MGKQAAGTEFGRMIVDDAIGLIPKAYKKLKNKLFKKNKAAAATSIQPTLYSESIEVIPADLPKKYIPW